MKQVQVLFEPTHLFNGFSLQTCDFSIDGIIKRQSGVWITATEKQREACDYI